MGFRVAADRRVPPDFGCKCRYNSWITSQPDKEKTLSSEEKVVNFPEAAAIRPDKNTFSPQILLLVAL